jgi:2-oxoglutarate ferredoxin oxidoreductase subunit alpha
MLGAMHMGTRAMVGTSGGGFALMAEATALAAITETPAVITVCSRPGPATGLPTWTEQGDLKFIVNAGHGDFPRIVLAPSNPQEAFSFASLAFNLAEKYQLPVFILLDKYTSEGGFNVDSLNTAVKIERGKILRPEDIAKMKESYLRFKIVPDGVSPRALPGTLGGVHLVNSDEHDEYGYAIEGWHEPMRVQQVDKRARKLLGAMKELPKPQIYGPKRAKITLMGWGSTKGPVFEAMKYVKDVNYLHVPSPWPIQPANMVRLLKGVKKLVNIENNYSGQFAHLLRAETGITPHKQLLKYDGRQFWPMEIVEKVKKL